jgi:quinoprotein glucose dehydrogenase
VAGNLIIGGAVNDNYSTQEQSGVIRALDINSGALSNSWSVLSVDEELGSIYVPLGNQVPDQLGMTVAPRSRSSLLRWRRSTSIAHS